MRCGGPKRAASSQLVGCHYDGGALFGSIEGQKARETSLSGPCR